MNRPIAWLFLSLVWALPMALRADVLRVVYPVPESQQDAREAYPLEVLRLALEHSGVDYRLESGRTPMQQSRSLRELEAGRSVDIVWTVNSPDRQASLFRIPFPIDRGLVGWRVLLVRQADIARFGQVTTKQQLAAFTAGQGHDWPDLDILRRNGLPTLASPTYEGLFTMLERYRIDYFPRSLAEVEKEHAQRPGRALAVEPSLLLHYHTGLYFFVKPGNRALADAVTSGLQRAVDDGSFQQLFATTYGLLEHDLGLSGRRIIELDNDFPPDEIACADQRCWYRPGAMP